MEILFVLTRSDVVLHDSVARRRASKAYRSHMRVSAPAVLAARYTKQLTERALALAWARRTRSGQPGAGCCKDPLAHSENGRRTWAALCARRPAQASVDENDSRPAPTVFAFRPPFCAFAHRSGMRLSR